MRPIPLMPYASRTQVEFLFDIDSWDRDRLDPQRAGQWLAALHKAGADQVARWLREGDEATVVLVLSRLLRVFKLDESTDPDFWRPDRPVPLWTAFILSNRPTEPATRPPRLCGMA